MTEIIEVAKDRFSTLEKANEFLTELMGDSDVGLAIKRKAEKKFNVKIPEVSLADAQEEIRKKSSEQVEEVRKENKTLQDRLDKWESKQKEDKEESDLQRQLEAVQKKYSFTSEGMDKVIARMKEKNNPDAEAAAALVISQEPKAKPVSASSYAPSSMNLYGSSEKDDKWEMLNRDPIKFFDQEVANVLNEFANGEAA